MKKLKLELEMLEERITPSWLVNPPGLDSGDVTDGRVGPDPDNFPTKGGDGDLAGIANNEGGSPVAGKGAWNGHIHSDTLSNPE